MRRGFVRLSTIAIAVVIAGALAGCAGVNPEEYPRLGLISNIKQKLLSQEEQSAAIRELSLEQSTHRGNAQHEIEKR